MLPVIVFFFFNDTATTEIYTLSLHDALPISARDRRDRRAGPAAVGQLRPHRRRGVRAPAARDLPDRKSTRLNSSHANISYAVFCLKKKMRTIARESSSMAPIRPMAAGPGFGP